ncbi:uncharacterized protein LOC112522760 [Cynara cardunculus var. scolymus]|uniref:uncharacterized protein LOC112522760 n=1 Tax=Cynara cardunculus var. scolymus TaxID=59895 RepID=UPI000D626A6E|nr:uncharacterized protein LOC112522760 [Cynara cardunculus var. scolymus]
MRTKLIMRTLALEPATSNVKSHPPPRLDSSSYMNVSRRFHIHAREGGGEGENPRDNLSQNLVKGEAGRLKEVLMVLSGKRRGGGEREAVEEEEEEMERLKPLHNFDLPCLKWGNQRLLRCMKVDSKGEVSAMDRKQSSESGGGRGGGSVIGTRRREMELERRYRSSDDRKVESYYKCPSSEKLKARAGDGEIEATREKLMFDFQTEVGKMKDAILRESFVVPPPAPATTTATTSTSPAERPWNLRTRRAACKAPSSSNGVNGNGDIVKPNVSPVRNECRSPKSRPVGGGATATTSGEKRERPKFSITLSRRELEDDFTAMAGRRLPRKPKKRPRIIQKQLDTLFPGLWLTEITADLYRVPDEIETGKR